METSPNRHGPCEDKNCSICCDPVKVNLGHIRDGNFIMPKDKEGNDLWKKRDGFISPEGMEDDVKIVTFDCVNFDRDTGKCLDYENRPSQCRKTTCIIDEKGDIDEQHRDATERKFTKIG